MSKYVMQEVLDALNNCPMSLSIGDAWMEMKIDEHTKIVQSLEAELSKPDATTYFTDSEDGVYIHMICGGIHLGLNLSEMDGFADNFIRAYRNSHETT